MHDCVGFLQIWSQIVTYSVHSGSDGNVQLTRNGDSSKGSARMVPG